MKPHICRIHGGGAGNVPLRRPRTFAGQLVGLYLACGAVAESPPSPSVLRLHHGLNTTNFPIPSVEQLHQLLYPLPNSKK
jgi:hypothetical protein